MTYFLVRGSKMEQAVNIELKTTIKDNGTVEKTTVKENGTIHTKGNRHVVFFEEKTEEQKLIKNMIAIQSDKVSIRRSGLVKMNQLFRAGERSENIYEHPHGRIHMDTLTEMINYQPFDGEIGKLTIDYTVKLNGQNSRQHQLTLTLKG